MATGTINFSSDALSGAATFSIILPDPDRVGPGPYPVLLQLHGRSDDHRAWLEKSMLWGYVEPLPLIVVMPSGHNFWWSNLYPERGVRYEDLLVQDLWEHVQAMYPARPGRWAIGGLSMGGFGAIRLGLKYPEKFCSIYAHSSAIPDQDTLANWFAGATPTVLSDLDCYAWAEQRTVADLPRLGFDCGTEDHLIKQNRAFHSHLEALGLPHVYAEYPGGHTWPYWDLHVQEALIQHCAVLGIAPVPPEPAPE